MSNPQRTDPDAERAVLGGILLLGVDGLETVIRSGLEPSHFFEERHRLIYRAAISLATKTTDLDMLSLKCSLEPEQLEKIGIPYLADLTSGIPSNLHIDAYARRVLDTAKHRRLVSTLSNALDAAASGNGSLAAAIEDVRHGLFEYDSSMTDDPLVVLDASTAGSWDVKPLRSIFEGLFARGTLMNCAAASQSGKTLLGIFIAVEMIRGGLLFGKFPIHPVDRVLYLVLEDPPRRIRDRILDLLRTGDQPIPPGKLDLGFWPGFNLTDDKCIRRLETMIEGNHYDVVFLDTYQRATPGISSFDPEKQSIILHRLSNLTRRFDVALWVNDHFRKAPNSKRRAQPDQDDVKGDGGKIQNADSFLLLDRTGNQIRVRGKSKDYDLPIGFLLDVAPQGCTDRPKFQYVADLEELSQDMKALGNANRQKVLDSIAPDRWTSRQEIELSAGLQESTILGHLRKLHKLGKIEILGQGKARKYRHSPEANETLFRENQ